MFRGGSASTGPAQCAVSAKSLPNTLGVGAPPWHSPGNGQLPPTTLATWRASSVPRGVIRGSSVASSTRPRAAIA
eukprot:7202081-Pyramimonas_sp.AAC.1